MSGMIAEPGFYPNVTDADYHSDPTPGVSASASILHTLYSRSPRHAWYDHPRLNPNWSPSKGTPAQAFGKAAHALLFGNAPVEEVDALDWRTKDAKAERDRIEADGGIALLPAKMALAKNMIHTLRQGLKDSELGDVFDSGAPEITIAWREDKVWCRGRIDWWREKDSTIIDYKTVTGSASPDVWSHQLFNLGSDFQATFYPMGVAALRGRAPRFIFIVQEVEPPHAFSIIQLSDAAREVAENKVAKAFAAWRRCLESKVWPGYPSEICEVHVPAWEARAEAERDALAAANKGVFSQ